MNVYQSKRQLLIASILLLTVAVSVALGGWMNGAMGLAQPAQGGQQQHSKGRDVFTPARFHEASNQRMVRTPSHTSIVTPHWIAIPTGDGGGFDIIAVNLDGLPVESEFIITGTEQTGIGPSNYQHSYTMVYSSSSDTYLATTIGMVPQAGFVGAIQVAGNPSVTMNEVAVSRYYFETSPAAATSLFSTDGLFEVMLLNPNTLENDVYLALAENDFPPDMLPAGHRLIGKSYSFRQSVGDVTAEAPMLLRFYYDPILLHDVSAFQLGVFVWDTNTKAWQEVNSRLFVEQRYLSVGTENFTTYTLQAAARWYDDFDDINGLNGMPPGLDLGVRDGAYEYLMLAEGATSGFAISEEIKPPADLKEWGTLTYVYDTPAGTNLTVDILSQDDELLLGDVSSGSSLDTIRVTEHPVLRLRATLSTTNPSETPTLDSWRLSWKTSVDHKLFLPQVIK